MDDTQHPNNFPQLNVEQIRELAATIREVFAGNLARGDFTDRLLTFLEDVPGYESGDVAANRIESGWTEYATKL